jgi:hypothetical protein
MQEKYFNSTYSEIKFGYDWNYIISESDYEVFLVDREDLEWLSSYNWYVKDGYANSRNKVQTMHVIIMEHYFGKTPKGHVIDHINGNKLDNRKSNLRYLTYAQNKVNSVVCRGNTSGYKGVSLVRGRWHVNIGFSKKGFSVGSFDKIEHAALCYDLWSEKFYGDIGCKNIHSPSEQDLQFVYNSILFKKKLRCGSSSYRGVKINGKKFEAYVYNKKEFISLGRFVDEKEAALAVDKKLIELGRDRELNFNPRPVSKEEFYEEMEKRIKNRLSK